jgi:hypothetical protein
MKSKYNNMLFITALCSLVYGYVMLHGYYNLLISSWGGVVAFLAALLPLLIAFALIRMIAHDGGIRANKLFFVMLLLVSAVGVFNSLMLTWRGDKVFYDTANDAAAKFQTLSQTAQANLSNPDAEKFIGEVNALKQALGQEMRNPVNCGEGAASRQIMARIKEKLPSFTQLSGGFKDCSKVDEMVALYDAQVDKALYSAPILAALRYEDVVKVKNSVTKADKDAKVLLDAAAQDLHDGKNKITVVRPQIENIAALYRETAQLLSKNLPADAQKGLATQLDLSAVQALGDPSQFLQLIVSRIGDWFTWFVVVIAVALDSILIVLFARTHQFGRAIQTGKKTKPEATNVSLKDPWA